MGIFLPSSALPGLKKYKYAGEDHSPISKYILKPFYNKFSYIFPQWLAPNLVTLLGLSFVLVNFATMLYYNPSLSEPSPPWVYVSYAIGLFLYQTFDACDGIQARRTGQSGPLGELFDHCVDAINTTLEVILFASAVNMGYGWYVVASQFGTLWNFYLSTWEEYHTGILYLSTFSGPVEGILMVIGFFLTTAYFGPEIWKTPLLDLFNVYIEDFPDSLKSVNFTDLYMVFAIFALGMNSWAAAQNVIKARSKNNLPLLPALIGLIPFISFYITLVAWIYLSPSLLHEHLLPLAFATGIAFAFTVGRIIVAHVTKQTFPFWNPLLFLPVIGIAIVYIGEFLSWDPDFTSICSVWGGLGLSLGVYGSFITEIIYEITTYLDIGCLYIKHPITDSKKK